MPFLGISWRGFLLVGVTPKISAQRRLHYDAVFLLKNNKDMRIKLPSLKDKLYKVDAATEEQSEEKPKEKKKNKK